MPYTPVELRHVRVPRALLGFKRDAVQALLTEVADNFETAWRERHELADHVERLEEELADLRAREQALSHALVTAEQAAARVRDEAHREAEVILAEAHSEARAVTRNAETERQRLLAETRRIEALLKAALGTMEEAGPERPAGWPQRDDPREAQPAAEAEPAGSEPPAAQPPQLRKVSGGVGWGEDR